MSKGSHHDMSADDCTCSHNQQAQLNKHQCKDSLRKEASCEVTIIEVMAVIRLMLALITITETCFYHVIHMNQQDGDLSSIFEKMLDQENQGGCYSMFFNVYVMFLEFMLPFAFLNFWIGEMYLMMYDHDYEDLVEKRVMQKTKCEDNNEKKSSCHKHYKCRSCRNIKCTRICKTHDLHCRNRSHNCSCRVCCSEIFNTNTQYCLINGSLYEHVCVENIIEEDAFSDIVSVFTHVDILKDVFGGGGHRPSPKMWMFHTSTCVERKANVLTFNYPLVIISLVQLCHQLLRYIRFRMSLFIINYHMCLLTHALEGPSIVSSFHSFARASHYYVTLQPSESLRNIVKKFMMQCVYYNSKKQDLILYTKKESVFVACKTVTLCEENINEIQYLNIPTKLFEKLNGNFSLDNESGMPCCQKSYKKQNPFSEKEFESTFSEETFQILFQHVDVRPASVEVQAYPASQPVLEPILKKFSNSQSKPTRRDTMAVEFLRLCTMHDYPNSNGPSLLRLAEAGFYFEGEGNTLVCFSCHVKRGNWEYSESPREVHRQISPNCPFLNSGDGNIPVPRENGRELVPLERNGGDIVADGMSNLAIDGAPTAAYASNHVAHLASSSSSNHSTAASYNEVDSAQRPARKVILVKHPEYANRSTRLSSYANFPRHMKQHPADMTEAGFYYAGFGDCCRCFHCGIGLRNWDPDDNPWIEHARWSAECPYILRIKGQAFIDLVQEAARAAEMREDGVNGEGNHVPKSVHIDHEQIMNGILSCAEIKEIVKNGLCDVTIANTSLKTRGKAVPSSLRNWDPDDNPWIEHARWSAECPYILTIKGQAFIDLVQEAARAAEMREDGVNGETNDSNAGNSSSTNEAASFIKDSANGTDNNTTTSTSAATASSESSGANNVVSTSEAVITSASDSGYGSGAKTDPSGGLRSEIKPIKVPLRTEAAQSLINEDGVKPKLVTEAIEELVKEEGWSSFSKENIKRYIKKEKNRRESPTENQTNDPETLKQENKELKDLTMCKICLDEKVSIVFLPCGHLVACPQCAPALTKCPICRKGIKGTVRTNLVDKQSV